MTTPTIDQALADRRLLGGALGDVGSWLSWLVVLKAAFGLQLSDGELATFRKIAGDRVPPAKRVRELWCVISRRSGKSRMAAALAVFLALFRQHKLARGETGHVLVLAATQDQAKTVFDYAAGFIDSSEALRREVVGVTQHEIRLRNNTVIGVHVNSYRTIRGKTLLAVVADEIAFWRDEASATPDIETYRAVMPSLVAANGMLIGISTPYRRAGLLHAKHRDHFGVAGDDCLVVQGDAATFNPTLDAALIEAHRASDPEAAVAEWDAMFRSDLVQFLSEDLIELAIDCSRPPELPPRDGISYYAFTDPSGGRHDAFTLAVGHKDDNDRFICDVLRGKEPPFDPQEVTREYAALAREYRCSRIYGDNFSADWVVSAFAECDVSYVRMEKNKSELYLEGLPSFSRGLVMLPEHRRLGRELRLLERHVTRAGRDRVDHGKGGSDDFANAVFGCLHLAVQRPSYELPGFVGIGADGSVWMSGGPGGDDIDEAERERAAAEAEQRFQSERYRNHILATGGYWNAPLWRR
jgi:hypothetical protein